MSAAFVILIVLAVAVPSAGHSWNGAGGSPLRHLTAVVPLAALPLGAAVKRWGNRSWLWVTGGVLALFSLHNGWVYNVHHVKEYGPMVDASASGWKTLLLFPRVFAPEPMTRHTFDPSIWLFVWMAIAALVVVAPWLARRRGEEGARRRMPVEAAVALAIVAVAPAGIAVGLATSVPIDPAYAR